jgi:translation elongation factor EF-1beta
MLQLVRMSQDVAPSHEDNDIDVLEKHVLSCHWNGCRWRRHHRHDSIQ